MNKNNNIDKKNILAIECAGGSVSACVYKGSVMSEQYADIPYSHVQHLMPMVDSVVNASGLIAKDIDMIAVSTGPGFFTGMRVGIATANGLSIGLGVPVHGISTMEAFAQQLNCTGKVLVVLETKRKDYYAQIFDGLIPLSDILSVELEALVAMLGDVQYVAGSGIKRFMENYDLDEKMVLKSFDFPTASSVAKAVSFALSQGRELPVEPLYLRNADVNTPKHKTLKDKQFKKTESK